MIEETAKIVSCFVSGMSDYQSLHGNPGSVSRYVNEALSIIKTLHFEHFFSITVSDENSLLINGIRMSLDAPEVKQFFIKLRQKGVRSLSVKECERRRSRDSSQILQHQAVFSILILISQLNEANSSSSETYSPR